MKLTHPRWPCAVRIYNVLSIGGYSKLHVRYLYMLISGWYAQSVHWWFVLQSVSMEGIAYWETKLKPLQKQSKWRFRTDFPAFVSYCFWFNSLYLFILFHCVFCIGVVRCQNISHKTQMKFVCWNTINTSKTVDCHNSLQIVPSNDLFVYLCFTVKWYKCMNILNEERRSSLKHAFIHALFRHAVGVNSRLNIVSVFRTHHSIDVYNESFCECIRT